MTKAEIDALLDNTNPGNIMQLLVQQLFYSSLLKTVQVFKFPFQFLLKKLIGFSILAN